MKVLGVVLAIFSSALSVLGQQEGGLSGFIYGEEGLLPYASVAVEGENTGTFTDSNGYFHININRTSVGEIRLRISYTGYITQYKTIVYSDSGAVPVKIVLKPGQQLVDPVVITGTRTAGYKSESPVSVNIIDSKRLNGVGACNLAEGLRFQPGLRVETDCQTCNYTQLRMNGLGGAYAQILVNGRPVFSPLLGLYGMEQLPANMIDRIEIVRGSASALYGSSAIGGTVNIITKIPRENSYSLKPLYQSISGKASDYQWKGNMTLVNEQKNAGVTFFTNYRNREAYDHNGDNFSELPAIKNTAFGATLRFLPTDNQKLEISISQLNEYRYGGEMVDKPAHLARQSEEREHNVFIGNADYQLNFNAYNSSLVAYTAFQHTDRKHYTGIFPDDSMAILSHLQVPPYGTSINTTFQSGLQLNHRIKQFPAGDNVLTLGVECLLDDILDQIEPYHYKIDQTTQNLGFFFQSNWELRPRLTLLSGIRIDHHNLLDEWVYNPRLALLYNPLSGLQLRASWGQGFRAPQAFDQDLHIAFAGGGVSRISLSPALEAEKSNSFSASLNYDKASRKFVAGITLATFYTHLDNAFYLHPLGEDSFGLLFEKRNGEGATVYGTTVELRANYNQKLQLEGGFTLQRSLYDEAIENSESLPAKEIFLRTPNQYGYAVLSLMPNKRLNSTFSFVYTGSMMLVHFAGAPEQPLDEYVTSPAFLEASLKVSYTLPIKRMQNGLEVTGGVKNLFNAYQDDFDTGKNRDSNYVYGPMMPRTFFIGLGIKSGGA